MDRSTVITLGARDPSYASNEELWVKIIQEPYEEDTMSLEDTAELLDTLFDIDLCNPEEGETEDEVPEDTTITEDLTDSEGEPVEADLDPVEGEVTREPAYTEEDFQELLKTSSNLNFCNNTILNDFTTFVRIFVGNITIPHKLVVPHGDIVGEEVYTTETVQEILTVESATSVTLKYPVMGPYTYAWRTLISVDGDPEEYSVDKDTLTWDKEVTGTVEVSYQTSYYRVEVIVFSRDEDGAYGETSAIVFYSGLTDSCDLAPPETKTAAQALYDKYCGGSQYIFEDRQYDVTCYETHYHTTYCTCGGVADSRSEIVFVPCPSYINKCQGHLDSCSYDLGDKHFTGRTDCTYYTHSQQAGVPDRKVVDKVSTPEFYEEVCCHPPTVPLPPCTNYRVKENRRYMPADWVIRELMESTEGKLRLIGLTPEDGCGTTTYTQLFPQLDCCDTVEEDLTLPEDYADVLPPEDFIILMWEGGLPPFTVTTSNSHTSFSSAGANRRIVTEGNSVLLYADEDFCGSTEVRITDGCTTVTAIVLATEGEWKPIPFRSSIASMFSDMEPDSYTTAYHACGATVGKVIATKTLARYKFEEYQGYYKSAWFGSVPTIDYYKHFYPYKADCGYSFETACLSLPGGGCVLGTGGGVPGYWMHLDCVLAYIPLPTPCNLPGYPDITCYEETYMLHPPIGWGITIGPVYPDNYVGQLRKSAAIMYAGGNTLNCPAECSISGAAGYVIFAMYFGCPEAPGQLYEWGCA